MFKASAFKLSLYEVCPQQYKFVYVDRIAEEYKIARPYLTMGAHVHNALKDLYEKVSPEKRNFSVLERLFRARWKENRRGFRDLEEERKWGLSALAMLKLFCQRMDLLMTPVMLENYYEYQIDPALSVLGRIDRVDQGREGLHVIDYKTGKFKADDVNELQLQLYSLIVEKRTHQKVAKASFLFLPSFQWYSITPQPEDYDFVIEDVKLRARDILGDEKFLPRINRYCKNCDFLQICPAKEEALRSIKITHVEPNYVTRPIV
ncbi:MAG: hypothetical protein A3B74_01425 [Candidatus Kerfeldbacteria bacterium RIFCSPHIGHO2_02_FULL_42_14]|uniref:PD-(D/E)XK endonuclease-like domain-containing protein n=1 Tax=Candidatus Kerfeldbacteria bacterium RIFCSPHIGHO2_02_FULL_42_14 TaxID=1798540 RepID=A0A1G2ASX0_9BACT|nr:MAG: hypothetical protein A3B74_01425 [Candidatus Kerfeldbacteria bacterium RIFCSPHIGHO2_02_FULL_42_14]OGY81220.1 MAG: hypothetical protein A3E60_02940 [Candidatus Kerfeldbacteria bacterium RIFCSPHIGHO2_12_FULL_42_13]OGY83360.1 MAG: hypothetical protein A3I91_01770 [Candidatus Kerfeldbacteria bacterium RIFCSPLOWO2_02_FULL_42_19]OGY86378.1 MAG: hypothetical protein A3G01_05270 [Candidatus Kerfeldbacteria bacterium RIFCSPLOWO2_12_FULL_43_9]